MLLNDIVAASKRVTKTSSRLEKIEHLSDCLHHLRPDELDIGVAYLSGKLHQGRIGIGPAVVSTAHPGAAAGSPSLNLVEVNKAFDRIKDMTGPGSMAGRTRLLRELLSRATREEQDFLAKLILGELRQGALEGLMVEAIARAADVSVDEVRRALMLTGDLPTVAHAALCEGRAGLKQFSIRVLHPIQPMLAQTAEHVSDALDRLGSAGLEWKLDGARVQVHKAGQDIRVFSRRLNDVTASVPEIVEALRSLAVPEVILDGEVLALRADGAPQPFQTTMRRFGRKLDVDRMREALPLTPFFFDCLYLEGQDLIDRPNHERFRALSGALPANIVIPRLVTTLPAEAQAFLEKALRRGHEGLIAKSLEASYEAGRRGFSWLKLKPTQTLDLVILAAEWGHGRRQGWLSNLHLGARDPSRGEFVMLGKTFKGMTDKMLAWQTRKLLELEIGRDAYTVYVRPELVAEIAFSELQRSPQYPAGLALRFARVKRYRPDKRPEDADTIDTVRAMYQQHGGAAA